MRPFGLNTLSINIYELTSEGEWEKAAASALSLLIVGAPLVLFQNLGSKKMSKITVRDLSFSYGKTNVLKDINFHCRSGEISVFLEEVA